MSQFLRLPEYFEIPKEKQRAKRRNVLLDVFSMYVVRVSAYADLDFIVCLVCLAIIWPDIDHVLTFTRSFS